MPSHKVHKMLDRLVFGREYDDVHKWIDNPVKRWGKKHRMFRHSAVEVVAKYGFTDKALAGLLHIALDFATSEMKRKIKKGKKRKKL